MPTKLHDPTWEGDDPTKWPEKAKERNARWEARMRKVRDGRRQRHDAALEALGRVALSRAIEMVAAGGNADPWRWLRAKLRKGTLEAWGTIGHRPDQELDPTWLDHDAIFTDERGWPKPPADDCLWFEPGDGRPHRMSEVAVDATALAALLAEWSRLRPGEPVPTGFPGRPSKGKNLIEDEFRRRCDAGESMASLDEEARALLAWYTANYPKAPRPTVKTIKNNIRDGHRQWTASQQQSDAV